MDSIRIQHERIQAELRAGHIGLAQNRLPATVQIEDVAPEQLFDARQEVDAQYRTLGEEALAAGAVAVVTLSGGAGSRWTQGRGRGKGAEPVLQACGNASHVS